MYIDLKTTGLKDGKFGLQPGRTYTVTSVTGISRDMGIAVFVVRTTDDLSGPYVTVPVDITDAKTLTHEHHRIDTDFDVLIEAIAGSDGGVVDITFDEEGNITIVGPRPTAEPELPPPGEAGEPAVPRTAGKMSAGDRRALFE